MRSRRITVDHLEITRRGGSEGAVARGSIEEDGRLNLDVHTSAWSLGDLDALAGSSVQLDGLISLGAHIGGSLSAPTPEGRLALWDTVLAGRAIGDSRLDFSTIGQTLSFNGNLGGSELGLAGTLGLGGDVDWALSADLAAFPAHSFYPVAPDGGPIRALVSGQVVASGQLGPPDRPFRLDFETTEVELGWDRHLLKSQGPWRLSVGPQRFSLAGVELVGGQSQLSFGGSRAEGGPTVLAGDGVLDLDLLRAVVPGLERSQGLARVELSLSGGRGDLEPVITARIVDGRFHASWLPEALESVQARLSGREGGYQLQSLTGRMGGGALTGGGRIDAKDWLPSRYDLWAKLGDARVEYFDWLPAITGDASLAFVGPAEEPLLSGRVDVRDMLFADRIAWEDAVVDLAGERLTGATAEETADLFSLDVQLVGQRSIRVRNNLGDLVASGDLRLVGDTSRPGLVGDIRAETGGRVYLKEREFELVRGELHFVEPYAFDPELDIALRTNVQTREDRYLIDYRVAGPWSDWRGESTSDPGLPEADINALLLFGMTRAELERYGGAFSALALEGGDLLASKFGLVETLGQGLYGLEILRPERIDLVSGVTERGAGTVSSELRIIAEKDLDWATIILEQNLSRLSDTYVSLERRLANRLYMRGFWAREQVGRQLNIGGAWGLNVNLRWELD